MRKATILFAAAAALLASQAVAQGKAAPAPTDVTPDASNAVVARMSETVADQLIGTGPSRAGETLPEFAFAPLVADKDEVNGKVALDTDKARNSQKAEVGAANDGGTATFKFVRTSVESPDVAINHNLVSLSLTQKTLSIVVGAPFQKGSDESPVITSSGLPSDFHASIGYSAAFWSASFDFDAPFKDRDALIARCNAKYGANTVIEGGNTCTNSNDDILRGTSLPLHVTAALVGGEASVGYQKFDFFDMATAVKSKTSKTPWSASAYVGWIWGADAPLLLAKISYEDSFKAADDGTLCPVPAPVPAVLTCVTGAIGAPSETQSFLATLELRRELKLNGALADIGIESLGIDAKFTYDTKSDVYAFDLPLSFAVDDKGNLVGGVDFGWQSDHHDFIAGVFLNSAFSLF